MSLISNAEMLEKAFKNYDALCDQYVEGYSKILSGGDLDHSKLKQQEILLKNLQNRVVHITRAANSIVAEAAKKVALHKLEQAFYRHFESNEPPIILHAKMSSVFLEKLIDASAISSQIEKDLSSSPANKGSILEIVKDC